MRITLNLASQPYVELRPLYQRLRLWLLLHGDPGGTFWLVLRVQQTPKATRAQAEQTILVARHQKLKQEQQNNQSRCASRKMPRYWHRRNF